MHDPMMVAFQIRRPWPTRRRSIVKQERLTPSWRLRGPFWVVAGWEWYWPPFITIWHREPGGRDAGEVCRYSGHWRWHVQHWVVRVRPLQFLRRRFLTRCQWCGGRDRKDDPVNIGGGWYSPKTRWWQGEADIRHQDCDAIARAHRACVCPPGVGIYQHGFIDTGGYGLCLKCGKYRAARSVSDLETPAQAETAILSAIPAGQRDPAAMALVKSLWVAYRLRKGQTA